MKLDRLLILHIVDAGVASLDAADAGEPDAAVGQRRVQGTVMLLWHSEAELVVIATGQR